MFQGSTLGDTNLSQFHLAWKKEAEMNGKSRESEGKIYLQDREFLEEELEKQVGVMSECLYQTMKEFIKLQNVIYCHKNAGMEEKKE